MTATAPAPAPAPAPVPLRIAIVAEHASARFGGEAALPLHYFRVLRRRGLPVWLITHARVRNELQTLYPNDPHIVYIEDSAFHVLMWRIGRHLPDRIANFTTGYASRVAVQIEQRALVRRLVEEQGIDLVHQPMPVSPREPSMLHGFGVPVVIGPMNGGMDYPPAFRAKKAFEQIAVAVGRFGAELLNRLMPGKRHAALLLVANERTRRALPNGTADRAAVLVENGVDLSLWDASATAASNGASGDMPTTFVFLGRLVDWKRVDLLLRAFAEARQAHPMRLLIIGDGIERPALEKLATDLGISANDVPLAGQASFAGWLPQARCAEALRLADALVLPSILECGGAVVLEAMSSAKPVIATAWGGPADYLDDACGILVEPHSEGALVSGLAAAMVRLSRSPEDRALMGANGRQKVLREYDWEVKVDRILEHFREAVDRSRMERGVVQ